MADLRIYNRLRPNSAEGMNALGYTLLSQPQHLNEAFGLIQAAYQLQPKSAAINDSLGWAYFLKGDARAALPLLQFAYQQMPDPEVAAHLGEVLWTLGQRDEARRIWAEALQQDAQHKVLNDTLKRLGVSLPVPSAAPVK